MTFELNNTAAKLTSVTPRTEVHGDERVFAISLGIQIRGANTLLDKLSPGLRETLYKAVDDQDELPEVESVTPLLRSKGIDQIALAKSLEGWTINIDHGIDENAPITLGGCSVKKFRVVPHEGGSIDLSFSVGSNDIDATEAGLLCSHLSQEIVVTLTAPIPKEPAIDGTAEAFRRDTGTAPDDLTGNLFDTSAAAQDATDAFIRSGTDEGLGAGDEQEQEP